MPSNASGRDAKRSRPPRTMDSSVPARRRGTFLKTVVVKSSVIGDHFLYRRCTMRNGDVYSETFAM
jgi:hypothetical protein